MFVLGNHLHRLKACLIVFQYSSFDFLLPQASDYQPSVRMLERSQVQAILLMDPFLLLLCFCLIFTSDSTLTEHAILFCDFGFLIIQKGVIF